MALRDEALFINGVFESVLDEIVLIQKHVPEQILYLQPYSPKRINHLAGHRPSVEDRVRLFLSISTDLAHGHFAGEIVGWDNKLELEPARSLAINRVLWTLQPQEGGLYFIHSDEARQSVNLLHVWRLCRLRKPFSVGELQLVSTGEAHSTDRTTAGGWSYVHNPGDEWLSKYW